jgi:long-chain fatty acid transport protein
MPSRVRYALLFLLGAGVSLSAAGPVLAGGFALPDQGARALGLGGAFVARASGADSFQSNFAGVAFGDRPELVIGAASRLSQVKFTGADPFPGALAEETQKWIAPPAPTFGYVHPVGEHIVLGLGFSQPFGLRTSWDSPTAFSGRFIAQTTSLTSHVVTPGLAVRLADRLAVGGAVDLHFTRFSAERRLAAVNPFTLRRVDGATVSLKSDTISALGFRVGFMARPSEAFSLGVAYRQGVSFDLSGTATVERLPTGVGQLDSYLASVYPPNALPFSETVSLPSVASAGVAYTWTDWTFSGQVDIERWGSFGSLAIRVEGAPDLTTTVARDYEDTYALRLGLERRLSHAWTMRAGYAYVTTPVSTPESLTPVFVDANRHEVAVGFSVKAGAWHIDLSSGAMFYAKRATQGASPEGYDGTYENLVPVFGLTIGHAF